MVITSKILDKTGSIHSKERLPWSSVMRNHKGETGSDGLNYTLKCVSVQHGTSLTIPHSGV